MSFYYCKDIKQGNDNIEVEVAPSNVSPLRYEWGNVPDLPTLAKLVYYNELQLRSTARRSAIGKKIIKAIQSVVKDDRPLWQRNSKDWKEQGKKELQEILAIL